jgi:hypothetical protein
MLGARKALESLEKYLTSKVSWVNVYCLGSFELYKNSRNSEVMVFIVLVRT